MKQSFNWVLFVAVFFISFVSVAQTTYEDVLYLKNGSILHGIIIEQVPNESIKIQTKDRNVFVYRMDEVLKIAKEEVAVKPVNVKERPTKENIKTHGYINITEIAFGRDILNNGSGEAISGNLLGNAAPSIGVQTVNGYLFNPFFSAGLGIGLHQYSELMYVPIFADVRVNFIHDTWSPFLSFGGGYSFTGKEIYGLDVNRKYFGGSYLNPSIGIKFNTRKTKGMAFSIGYRYQGTRILETDEFNYYPYSPHSEWKNYSIGYLILKVGFLF